MPNKSTNLSIFIKFYCYFLICSVFYSSYAFSITLFQDPSITQFEIKLAQKDKKLQEQIRQDIIEQRKISDKNKISYSKTVQINNERTLIRQRLDSLGFYGAKIITQSRPDNKKGTLFQINRGAPYKIERSRIEVPKSLNLEAIDQFGQFKEIQTRVNNLVSTPISAQKIITLKDDLTQWLTDNACLYKIAVKVDTVVAHNSQRARVNFIIQDSPKVNVGKVRVSNNIKVKSSYLQKLIQVEPGDCFKQKQIDNTRLKLIRTGLFNSVTADISQPKPDNTVDIVFKVTESLTKTTEVGLSFDNDDGAGIALGWEHRNIFGRAEKLDINTLFNQNDNVVRADLLFPNIRQLNQNLSFYIDLSDEKTDAFDSQSLLIGTELSRFIGSHITASVGAEIAYSTVIDFDMVSENDEFALFSTPFNYNYDKRNDPLNTRKGWAASALLQPFWTLDDPSNVFVKASIAASYYLSFDKTVLTPTFAMRTAIGTINGANRDNVPINYRFFSGGGGSVRGFAFQSLGPSRIDPTTGSDDLIPTGGLSFSEVAFEGRINITKSIGLVAFVDGGLAYEQSTPQLDEQMRFGAGLGFRYYTSFAPIRVDIATPLNKKQNEDAVQLYISLGQAF